MMGRAKEIITAGMLYCDNCHCFNGTEEDCVKDGNGGLYCPICDTLVGYELQPDYARYTGLKFQDYIDYFKENSGVKILLNRIFGHVNFHNSLSSDTLSFDTLDFNNSNQINELLRKNSDDFRGDTKQTYKQYQTIVRLQDEVKEQYPDEYLLDNKQIKHLSNIQSSFLITYLTSLMSLLKRPTIKQYDFLKKLEKEYKFYYYFDDSLALEHYSFKDIYDKVSRFEMSERIDVLKEIKKYVNGDVSDILPDSKIDFDIFIDKVKEWKGLNKHDN